MPLFHRAQQPAHQGDGNPAPGDPAPAPFRAGRQAGITPEALAPEVTFSGTRTLLADVSEFQPQIADATYLKWSKAIIIRAAYGDAHDDTAWYGGQRRAQLHQGGAQFIGIYQFLVAGQDGAAQANALHSLVGGLQKGEVLIADFETGTKTMLIAWYNRMTALGYADKYLWTYTGLNFGQANGVLPVQWLADYTSTEPASAHTLWQFTDSYAVPGVGTCDCSVYHGSVAQLAALAYGGSVPTPIPSPKPPVTGTQDGWRWCDKCQCLVHGPGRCAAGGTHNLGAWNYSLPFSHPAP